MVYLANLEGDGLVFSCALFGVQYDGELTAEKKKLITTLFHLLGQSANRVDHLQDESHGVQQAGPRTTTFVAYWLKSSDYDGWKRSDTVEEFWKNLPDDAGVWREVMTVPKSRYMFAANQHETACLATVLGLKPSTDEGYWGVYRHRLSETPDEHTDPNDTFTSPLVTSPKAKGASPATDQEAKQVVDLSRSGEQQQKIRLGRVRLTKIPDNLCYCREGQRRPGLTANKEELETWKEKLAPYAQSWMNHLDSERNKNGVVSFSFNIGKETSFDRDSPDFGSDGNSSEAAVIPEADQLMYFLDLAHFERAGRSWKDHVKLRQTTMEMYGPGGPHSGDGKLSLFVELCVLKSGDLEAEYIGCKEGTGLMPLEGL
jgi:hypothetical protein